jgi:hypothetical protein
MQFYLIPLLYFFLKKIISNTPLHDCPIRGFLRWAGNTICHKRILADSHTA